MVKQIPSELTGVFAALPTPLGPDGSTLLDALDALVDFVLDCGLKGLCLGGATGEYAACSVEQRIEIFQRVARRTKGRVHIICGIGGEQAGQVRQLARAAAECGAIAVLFPPPGFLPYGQDNLVDFMGQVSADLPLPVLLYHIPQCAGDLGMANVLRLIAAVPNIIGLKDSSGRRPNLADIQAAQAHHPMVFMIGSDDLLLEAFERGAVGSISGIASACPELILPAYDALRAGNAGQARALQAQLDEFIFHLRDLPVPWAIKLALQTRGLEMGSMTWPMGPKLGRKAQEFQQWFAGQIGRGGDKAAARTPPGA
jgi:4-hydroxy-tetrahydrodipicolinate synthase